MSSTANHDAPRESQQEELRMNPRLLALIYDRTSDPVYLVRVEPGEQYRFISVNESFLRVTGYQVGQVVNALMERVVPSANVGLVRSQYERAIAARQPIVYEEKAELPAGTRYAEITLMPIFDDSGPVTHILADIRDITDRKQVEQERERLVAALSEADARKNEFLGMLAHELRNPLSPIRNSLYILQRASPGGEQVRRAAAVIDRQVSHLTRLVDDLLDVTRISRGKIRLQRTRLNLVDLVRQTVEDHRTLLEDHEVAVTLPEEAVWIGGDPTRVAQMVGNLLSNAAKFTPKGGRVSVSLTRDLGRAVVEVADTGLGIDPEMLSRLFEPFAQAERSLARTRGGLGLGLALVRGLVEQHGGLVKAWSEGPGKGARFALELPLDEQAAVTPRTQPALHVPSERRRVLVIEDNADAAESLQEALQLADYEVAVAHDGREGIEKARKFKPDVLLCDIGLPEMDGYEVARAFRADAALNGVFLVALTGYAGAEDQQRAAQAGFDRHLAKPSRMEQLEELLAQAPRRSTEPVATLPSPTLTH